MEVKNRRRQDSPFTCLKPLIRVWGVATAIGECPISETETLIKSPKLWIHERPFGGAVSGRGAWCFRQTRSRASQPFQAFSTLEIQCWPSVDSINSITEKLMLTVKQLEVLESFYHEELLGIEARLSRKDKSTVRLFEQCKKFFFNTIAQNVLDDYFCYWKFLTNQETSRLLSINFSLTNSAKLQLWDAR